MLKLVYSSLYTYFAVGELDLYEKINTIIKGAFNFKNDKKKKDLYFIFNKISNV